MHSAKTILHRRIVANIKHKNNFVYDSDARKSYKLQKRV